MKGKIIIIFCVMICATLIIFGVLFWTTPYRYEKAKIEKREYIVRVYRLTGDAEILSGYIWKRLRSENEIQPLTQDEIAKIIIESGFDGEGDSDFSARFSFSAYNGTEFTIKKIRLSIKAKDKQGKDLWQRIYEKHVDIPPFSKFSSSIELMDYAPRTVYGHWKLVDLAPEIRIEKVFGYKGE